MTDLTKMENGMSLMLEIIINSLFTCRDSKICYIPYFIKRYVGARLLIQLTYVMATIISLLIVTLISSAYGKLHSYTSKKCIQGKTKPNISA